MRRWFLSGVALLTASCALTSKAPPVDIRYFSPETLEAHQEAPRDCPAAGTTRLRLGHVASSAHLRQRIVFRRSPVELGAYETLRWTENPEEYMRRSLGHALFVDRPLTQAVSGAPPTLDVELVTFEEVRRGDARAGRVQIRFVLRDDREVLASDIVTVEQRASTPEFADVVEAIGGALEAATSRVGDAVAARLAREGDGSSAAAAKTSR